MSSDNEVCSKIEKLHVLNAVKLAHSFNMGLLLQYMSLSQIELINIW